MNQIAIIADDLTGASDSGVQFARLGYETSVLFQYDNHSHFQNEVVVIDTDSRSVPPQTAYSRVFQAANEIKNSHFSHIFKKVDSTLRGNLGIEIDAVLNVFSDSLAIVAPAFPSMGRITRNGWHYLNGIPIHRTEIARDPKCPVLMPDIGELLKIQTNRKIGYLDREIIAEGVIRVLEKLKSFRGDGIEIVVCNWKQTGT